jgi:hypothetical protein
LSHGGARPELLPTKLTNGAESPAKSSAGESLDVALSACDEVTVVITKGDGKVCLAVLESFDAPPYHVFRLRRKKKGKEKEGSAASTSFVHASRYENKEGRSPKVPEHLDGPPVRPLGRHTNASSLLLDFFNARSEIDAVLAPLLARLADANDAPRGGRPIVTLAVNAGVLDLVLNYLCSVQRLGFGGTGEKGDVIKSMLIFAADEEVQRAVAPFGVATFRHPAIGSFPQKAAGGYGDAVFTSLMWLKVVSVYSVLRLGYDCLFQDADVIWWRDPRPFFHGDQAEPLPDVYFQNDGARSQRYSPFSANTGFYYMRSTAKARLLMHDLLHSYNLISQWHSHQHVLCQLLIEHYSKHGLRVKILPHSLFSIGQQYHRKKEFMRGLVYDRLNPRPYVFHWSWTAGKHEKLACKVFFLSASTPRFSVRVKMVFCPHL